jgi:hypothetical protein
LGSAATASVGASQFGYVEFPEPEGRIVLKAVGWHGTAGSAYSLHPPTERFSAIFDADETGQAGTSYGWSSYERAALWSGSASSWTDLTPDGYPCNALGVGDGQQVGWAKIGGWQRAALWTSSPTSWVDLHPDAAGFGVPMSQSNDASDGRQVGWVRVNGVSHASLWSGTAASWIDLHPTFATASQAMSIDASWQVGTVNIDGITKACKWNGTAESCTILAPSGATMSWAKGTSLGEHVGAVGFSSSSFVRAALWTSSTWFDLHGLIAGGYESSEGLSIARDGANTYVTGIATKPYPSAAEAFLWTRCGADANGDRIVDDDDFVEFANRYELFLCDEPLMPAGCPSDFDRDEVVDDADFVSFADAYEAFVCP